MKNQINDLEVAWIGSSPSIKSKNYIAIPEILMKENYHRLPVTFHNRFQKVILTEVNLADFVTWPLILDEILVICSKTFQLTIRARITSKHFSIYALLNKLNCKLDGNVQLDSFNYYNENEVELTITGHKELKQLDNNWTFGIIWNGTNHNLLEKFVESVHNQTKKVNYEIIICGPFTTLTNPTNCIFISSDPDTEKMANISKKKNLIVENSKYSNICITHNRYELASNFIESFDTFGLDFEVIIVKQLLNQKRVPDWVSQGSDLVFTQNYLLNYEDYSPYQYVAGGMTIAKRNILIKHKWNHLMLWNTGEDLELSKRLRDNGIQFRFNPYTHANVLHLRQGILEDFKELPPQRLLNASYDIFANNIENTNTNTNIIIKIWKKISLKLKRLI